MADREEPVRLEKPDLYRLAPDGRTLRLRGARCRNCDGLSFPVVNYGCPLCGAPPEACNEEELGGEATLLEFITIHGKVAPGVNPPIVVGEAEIASGIVEEIELGVSEDQLRLGMTIQAVPVEIARGDERVVACRFVPKESLR
jgi:uncharacterized protein